MEGALNGTNGTNGKGKGPTRLILFATPASAPHAPKVPPPKRPGRGVLVTGTDTGVGKTMVGCALALAAKGQGWRVAAFKPVETGATQRAGPDATALARASATKTADVSGVLYREAVAPAVAAEAAGSKVPLAALKRRFERMRLENDLVLVEGAGGVAVPITWESTYLDLAEDWGLSAVVVARAGLGTLNHTVLTVRALRERGIEVSAIVLNGRSQRPDPAERTNPESLARLLPGLPIFVIGTARGKDPYAIAKSLHGRHGPHFLRLLKACSTRVQA